ncbi:shikimate kinase [Agromyces rhizosphaerae]|uniref:Shikimate kinase n=1 Tax=Agromyces rhizosphaerae TaxID=88374 RepID=A0A9W6CYU1_9MICO|nr:shikimate kinase [Agromyces rhizosphaerae]GLI28795.1 shikimate kinase [Agromyces rhizosphaerae]
MPERPLPLVLIGPMGSGKTKLGRRVSARLELPFIDTDADVVAKHGPIHELFAREGEASFRAKEREAVAAALRERAVVSLGGGAVLDRDTQHDLAGASVVRLLVDEATVAARLGAGGARRPLLDGGGIDAWARIAAERRPVYDALADLVVDTNRGTAAQLTDLICDWWRNDA